jgi:hypothetical protein
LIEISREFKHIYVEPQRQSVAKTGSGHTNDFQKELTNWLCKEGPFSAHMESS